MDAYGIDFGTTNSVLARASGSQVVAVPLDDASRPGNWDDVGFDKVMPTVVGFDQGKPTFGWTAKRQTRDRLDAVKRLFATSDTVTFGGRELKVEEVAAMFFRHIQQQAAATGLMSKVDSAVVTIPANSRGRARYRTKLSAGLAGIEVSALINEPTAAAMAHARVIGQDQRILVFDWGGGTLDVTVLQSFEGVFIEQSSKGIQRLGGLDVDELFLEAVLAQVPASSRWREEDVASFRIELELAKIQLSSVSVTKVRLPGNGGYIDVTRGQLEECIEPLISLTREPVQTCLRESPGRIDHLVMVGGSSKMPVIQRFVADIVGTPMSQGVDPMTAIAEGAAVAAGILAGTITDLNFFVGTEHALGTITHNNGPGSPPEFSVLINRNTKYPAEATRAYTPARDNQEQVAIEVIEGDPDRSMTDEENVILKTWEVPLEPGRTIAEAAFNVTFGYDVDGILRVRVVDQAPPHTVRMDEELAFGAAENRQQLPGMRRRVDGLMGSGPGVPSALNPPALSTEARTTVAQARTKVIPVVDASDRAELEVLVAQLEAAAGGDESAPLAALRAALRNHAYLL